MSGLLAEYGIDVEAANENAGFGNNIEDGLYEFVVADVYIKHGTNADSEKNNLIISFSVGDEGDTKDDWHGLPKDPTSPTKAELDTIGRYKRRLLELGVSPGQVNTVSREDLIGIRGTFELQTQRGNNGRDYQNIRNLKVSEGDDYSEPAEEAPAAKPAAKRAPAAKKAPARTAAPAAAAADDNPFA